MVNEIVRLCCPECGYLLTFAVNEFSGYSQYCKCGAKVTISLEIEAETELNK